MEGEQQDDGIGEVSPIPEGKTEAGISNEPHLIPHFEVRDCGFDTVGIAFEIDPLAGESLEILRSPNQGLNPPNAPKFPKAICDLDGEPTRVTVTEMGNWRLSVGFATVKGFPGPGVIYIEGRASALLARSASARELIHVDDLDRVEFAALSILWTVLGGRIFYSASDPRYRRWDLAVDVDNMGACQGGIRALEAFSSMRLPYWCQPGVNRVKRRVDLLGGVRWPAEGSLQFRIYDKGLEMGLPKHRVKIEGKPPAKNPAAEDPGSWLRLERQMRPTNPGHRVTTEDLQRADLRKMWLGRFACCLDAPSLTVCSPQALRLRLSAIHATEPKLASLAKRLIAESTACAEALAPAIYGDEQKLANDLLKLGLVLAKGLPAWQSVELKPLLDQAASSWTNKTRPRASSAGTAGPSP